MQHCHPKRRPGRAGTGACRTSRAASGRYGRRGDRALGRSGSSSGRIGRSLGRIGMTGRQCQMSRSGRCLRAGYCPSFIYFSLFHSATTTMYAVHSLQSVPTTGPATHPDGPPHDFPFPPSPAQGNKMPQSHSPEPPVLPQLAQALASDHRRAHRPDVIFAPHAHELYSSTKGSRILLASPPALPSGPANDSEPQSGAGANHYPSSQGVPRLPPILQVEKQQVTTSATQLASASRRRNEAHFVCPVPGCGSTFTRRFNLRGMHRLTHTAPYLITLYQVTLDHTPRNGHTSASGQAARRALPANTTASMPGLSAAAADHHLITYAPRRHQALHSAKSQTNICQGCKKAFSRLDALNVRLDLNIQVCFRTEVCHSAPLYVLTNNTVSFRVPSLTFNSPVRSDGGAECRLICRKYQNQGESNDQRIAAPSVSVLTQQS